MILNKLMMKAGSAGSAWMRISGKFLGRSAVLSAATGLLLSGCGGDTIPIVEASTNVSVDYAKAEGNLLRTERYNNLHTTSVTVEQRAGDIAFLNSKGMNGSIYRVWLNSHNEAKVPPCLEDVGSEPSPEKPCTLNPPFQKYLADADLSAKELLGNLRLNGAPTFMSSGGPDAAIPAITRILLAIKKAHPKLTYIEAWNEPDEPGTKIQPAEVYPYYAAVYKAVNNINRRLGADTTNYVPIKVGGPALYYFNRSWFATFFDAYAADRDAGKRLDFISYHAYVDVEANGTISPLKSKPRFVAGQRAELEAMLRARGIDTKIPSYVTETGVYPGPLCDMCDRTDYARSAAGIASLHYWFANESNTYPFNWLTRQRAGGLKDQFVTKNPVGPYSNDAREQLWQPYDPVPTNTFTPFGNMLLMKSMMKERRVTAQSSRLSADGIGVYAMAAEDASGASMMIWNYQGCTTKASGTVCPTDEFTTAISAKNLPANLRNQIVRERVFLIDQKTSNYFADASRGNLQEVSNKSMMLGGDYVSHLTIPPNGIYLILLEPI